MNRRYLLDTNVCIHISNKTSQKLLHHFASLAKSEVGMSIITYGELSFGAEKSHHVQKNKTTLQGLISLIEPLALPCHAAEHYGHIRNLLSKKGMIIGMNDLWIAGHALAENLILVTNNTKEFSRIPHLKIENWIAA